MPNTDKLRTWNVTLTTLSPLFIGSGKTLSPYSDFIQEGNNLIYLNQKKIEEAVSDKPELIDEYVKEIRRKMNNTSSDVSLKDFITTRLKLSLDSVTLHKVPLQGNIGKQQLRQFISTAGRPFIPGSTLKGAFRTAILYDWLINDNNGKKLLENFIENLEKTDSKNKEEKNEALKKINNTDIEFICFGGISEDPFRFLKITDSNCLETKAISALEISRVSTVNEKNASIPQPSECLGVGAAVKMKITIQKSNQNTKFSFLNNVEISDLMKKVSEFSKESILRELDELEGNKNFSHIFKFYEELEKRIKNKEIVLRIGGGKTFFENSIGLACDDDDSGEHLELFLLAIKMPKYKKGVFPKTRTAVMKNNQPFQPLGWIKLSIDE